jgi:hypothetical protein
MMNLGAFLQSGELITIGGGPPAAPEKKQRKKAEPRDPNQPKRPLTAYLLWLGENREKIHSELGPEQKRGEISSEGTKRWKLLPEEVKQVCSIPTAQACAIANHNNRNTRTPTSLRVMSTPRSSPTSRPTAHLLLLTALMLMLTMKTSTPRSLPLLPLPLSPTTSPMTAPRMRKRRSPPLLPSRLPSLP